MSVPVRHHKKISLEILSSREEQFYLALLKYKLSPNSDPELLKTIVDAIYFDKDSLSQTFELSPEQENKINEKLFSIHDYLLKSKKDSEDYFIVSKENFEKFQVSKFGKELRDLLFITEIIRHWAGKEESAEIKATVALLSGFLRSLAKGIGETVSKSLTGTLNTAIALNDLQQSPVKLETDKNGDLVINYINQKETITAELFIEKSGQIRKVFVNDEQNLNELQAVNDMYLKIDDTVMRLRELGDEMEAVIYENAVVKKRKLDLSNAIEKEAITISNINDAITRNEDGTFLLDSKKLDENQKVKITHQASEVVVYNYEEILKEQEKGKKEKSNSGKINTENTFGVIDEFFSMYLRLPKNSPEQTAARDRIIIHINDILKKHYPSITPHTSNTITGYISSRIGLLDTEQAHDSANRKQAYRKYLRDSVYNILKRNA